MHKFTRLAGGMSGSSGQDHLVDDHLRFARMFFEVGFQHIGDGLIDRAHDLAVAEFGLGLSFELRLGDLHRNDRCQTLPEIVARDLELTFPEDRIYPHSS